MHSGKQGLARAQHAVGLRGLPVGGADDMACMDGCLLDWACMRDWAWRRVRGPR